MNTTIEDRYIWLNGNVLHLPEAKVGILSPTAQFGANVFEGIRCYWNNDQRQLFGFRLDAHYKRLKRSQKLFQMQNKYSIEEMKSALIDVVRANQYMEDIAVRQTLFLDGMGSWSSNSDVGMFVAPIPKSKTNPEYNKSGLNCCISSWERINDNSLPPSIKCGANYINSRMAQLEAINNGFDTAIFLSNLGYIAEGPGSCLFLIKDGILISPALTDGILDSITRDTIIRFSEDCLKLKVELRTVSRTELYMCDEAFLCGSSMEITPINSVDHYKIGDGHIGSITKKIVDMYISIVMGNKKEYSSWLTPIY